MNHIKGFFNRQKGSGHHRYQSHLPRTLRITPRSTAHTHTHTHTHRHGSRALGARRSPSRPPPRRAIGASFRGNGRLREGLEESAAELEARRIRHRSQHHVGRHRRPRIRAREAPHQRGGTHPKPADLQENGPHHACRRFALRTSRLRKNASSQSSLQRIARQFHLN